MPVGEVGRHGRGAAPARGRACRCRRRPSGDERTRGVARSAGRPARASRSVGPGRRRPGSRTRARTGGCGRGRRCSRGVPHLPHVHGAVVGSFGWSAGSGETGCPAGRAGSGRARPRSAGRGRGSSPAPHVAPASCSCQPQSAKPQRFSLPPFQSTRLGCGVSRATLLAGLGLELAAERLLLGVGGAGEREVLPDHDAALVAHVVEVVGLVDAAAPDPQQVEVGADGLVDPAGERAGGDAGDGSGRRGSSWRRLTDTGLPLTTRANAVPTRRGWCRARPCGSPTRRVPAVELVVAAASATSRSYSGCSP